MRLEINVPEEFTVRADRFNNQAAMLERVLAAPAPVRSALKAALTYMYFIEGRTNLHAAERKIAEPLLDPAERVVIRWLATRTNGNLRAKYGKAALKAARSAQYRCQTCGYPDVRALNLDHVDGVRTAEGPFACLCANCHSVKSRRQDWTGKKKTVPTAATG